MTNKVGIITVNFNQGEGLAKTMQSVLDQTVPCDYIVIDGGSTDTSKTEIEKQASKLNYWISEKDNGVYDAMNKGIQASQAEYLLFLNSGDQLASADVIEQALPYLTAERDIVYGNLLINDQGKISEGFMPDAIDLKQMMNDTLWHPVSFVKRDLFLKYGNYDTSFKIVGDYDFFFRVIISKNVNCFHISKFISIFHLDGMSSSPSNVPIIRAEKELVQKKYLSQEQIDAFYESENQQTKSSGLKQLLKKWFR